VERKRTGERVVRGRSSSALALAALAACLLAVGLSGASFTDTTQNPQTVSADPDFVAPSAAASAIVKSQGGVGGYIRAGGTYFVYASVTDSGNPASGVASVKTNLAAITSGQTAVSLSPGSYTADGVSYDYRSAQLTASAGVSAGPKSYSLSLADADGNSRSQSFAVTVDNTALAGAGFETSNASGGTSGRAEKGDTLAFVFNEAVDPNSVVAGWNGSGAKSVTVSIADTSSSDTLTVSGATVGSVRLQGDYTSSGKTTTFAGSSLTVSGATLRVVLGADSSGTARTETSKNAPEWTPSASNYDLAGNACSTGKVTGESARQF
jgi:hypothetical protein